MQTGVSMDRSEATISSFSSWGVPGSLIMKPEITAPGGDIYSVNGAHLNKDTGAVEAGDNATYESMSGTSMAAPQMAGMAAVLGQYIRENGLDKKWTDGNARHLINSLLMSTATPMIETDSGSYYPILRQGAGLADVFAATQAKSFIMMDEPSLGLAPLVVRDIFEIIKEINRQGVTVLLIEQNANMALKTADLGYVLETGQITLTGTGRELLANEAVKKAYLGE